MKVLVKIGEIADVNLVSDSFHRTFTDILPSTPATENLPDMQGSGAVRDLRQTVTSSLQNSSRLHKYKEHPPSWR